MSLTWQLALTPLPLSVHDPPLSPLLGLAVSVTEPVGAPYALCPVLVIVIVQVVVWPMSLMTGVQAICAFVGTPFTVYLRVLVVDSPSCDVAVTV